MTAWLSPSEDDTLDRIEISDEDEMERKKRCKSELNLRVQDRRHRTYLSTRTADKGGNEENDVGKLHGG